MQRYIREIRPAPVASPRKSTERARRMGKSANRGVRRKVERASSQGDDQLSHRLYIVHYYYTTYTHTVCVY